MLYKKQNAFFVLFLNVFLIKKKKEGSKPTSRSCCCIVSFFYLNFWEGYRKWTLYNVYCFHLTSFTCATCSSSAHLL